MCATLCVRERKRGKKREVGVGRKRILNGVGCRYKSPRGSNLCVEGTSFTHITEIKRVTDK